MSSQTEINLELSLQASTPNGEKRYEARLTLRQAVRPDQTSEWIEMNQDILQDLPTLSQRINIRTA